MKNFDWQNHLTYISYEKIKKFMLEDYNGYLNQINLKIELINEKPIWWYNDEYENAWIGYPGEREELKKAFGKGTKNTGTYGVIMLPNDGTYKIIFKNHKQINKQINYKFLTD